MRRGTNWSSVQGRSKADPVAAIRLLSAVRPAAPGNANGTTSDARRDRTALGFLFVAKPTIGAAMFAARPSWWPIVGAVILCAIAFIVQPTWVMDWRDAVVRTRHKWLFVAPITYPGGVIVLLALLRWRRPEARLIAALASVPQTTALYEGVPLFLVPH
jgi:hypothetical protein